ncbi:MAG: Crp/Fnr family transcriptional regulator [Paramuribaculum sp.]|nr:Crp/Fnr family transcriptional regulator [Paramuribaculum sp.]MDE7471440.1 Crp/Fnr family transcriptional regulator [Paramuribaculum sp.]
MVTADDIPVIIGWLRSRVSFADSDLRPLLERLFRVDFPRRAFLVSEGFASGHVYFIEQGMIRCYWMVDGQEITTSFSVEGSVVFSMDEVYYGTLSEEYVQAIEPVVAYALPIDDLHGLISTSLLFARWWSVIHQDEYRRLHRSHKERLTLPARERYHAFAESFPDVCRRASLADIASYLGITPSTMSRIRRP